MPTAHEVDGAGELTDTGLTDERTTRVVEAVRANAETAGLVDQMSVETDGGRVILSGEVPDLDDEDAAMAVAAQASGTTDVVSRLAVAAVDEGGAR
jgi:osmotically-inducible protein OsmY